MKKLLFAFLTLCTLSSYSQSKEPFKGANTIKIICKDTSAYSQFTILLLNNGYTIAKRDPELKTGSTEDKSFGTNESRYIIDYRVFNDTLFITGRMSLNISLMGQEYKDYDQVRYTKGKTLNRMTFDKMVKAANLISSDLFYDKK